MKLLEARVNGKPRQVSRALFLGRPDWEDRIEVQLTSLQGAKDAYLRFRTASANVTQD